jgi:hypothetical protein
MTKALWFDMDGTIADLYGVENWLPKLINSDPSPYADARPLVNMSRLAKNLRKAKSLGYTLNIVSWTSKNGTTTYNAEVAKTKRAWLKRHLPSISWDIIAIVEYGTPKSTCGSGILFDDEQPNRKEWGDNAYAPTEIFDVLKAL